MKRIAWRKHSYAEKIQIKAVVRKINLAWLVSGREEMPQARGESDNLKHVIEFSSLLEG